MEKSVFSKKMSEKSISREGVFIQLNEIAGPLQLVHAGDTDILSLETKTPSCGHQLHNML